MAFAINKLLLLTNIGLLMKLNPIFSLNSTLHASNEPQQTPIIAKEKEADLFFCPKNLFIFGDLSHASQMGVFTVFISDLFRNGTME